MRKMQTREKQTKHSLVALIVIAFCLLPSLALTAYAVSANQDEILAKGKALMSLKDYTGAIQVLSRALAADPLNQNIIDLIEESKFQSEYAEAVFGRLEADQKAGLPYVKEMTRLANQMREMMVEADSKVRAERDQRIEKVSGQDVQQFLNERQEAAQEYFRAGMSFFREGKLEEAFLQWDYLEKNMPQDSAMVQMATRLRAASQVENNALALEANELINVDIELKEDVMSTKEASPIKPSLIPAEVSEQAVRLIEPESSTLPLSPMQPSQSIDKTPKVAVAVETEAAVVPSVDALLAVEELQEATINTSDGEIAFPVTLSSKIMQEKPILKWLGILGLLAGFIGILGFLVAKSVLERRDSRKKEDLVRPDFTPKKVPQQAMMAGGMGDHFDPSALKKHLLVASGNQQGNAKRIEKDFF